MTTNEKPRVREGPWPLQGHGQGPALGLSHGFEGMRKESVHNQFTLLYRLLLSFCAPGCFMR
jgi:hypothetical protein